MKTHPTATAVLACAALAATLAAVPDPSPGPLPADTGQQSAVIGARCFAPGTPPEVVAAVGSEIHGLGLRYFTAGRWGGTAGAPVSLTYSFPPDGTFIDTGTNILNATLDSRFASAGGTAVWKSLFRQMFDAWEAVSGNEYTEVSDDGAQWPGSAGAPGLRGDIRIVSRNIDGGSGTLAFNYFPGSGGDMLIDSSENWASGPGTNYRFFRNTISHEHGHGQGLAHSCPQDASKIMEPFINTNFDGPQLDDMRGSHALYGDRLEPNNNIGEPTDLEAIGLVEGLPLDVSLLSLNGSADSDVFRFTAPLNGTITVIAAPGGGSYLNGPQLGGGACSAGSMVDSLRQQDLLVEVLNAGGGVIHPQNANGIGLGESFFDYNLGTPGVYFVRIRSAASNGDVQLYNVSFILEDLGLFGDLNNNGCVDATDLAILLGAWGPAVTSADLNGDGAVNSADVALLLGAWGSGMCS